jgi:hypothetical protein
MRSLTFAVALACTTLVACAPGANMITPTRFGVLEKQKEYVYRAATPEGVVIAVRAEANKPKGSLEFWAAAIDTHLRRSGYAPDGTAKDVRTSDGLPGREARYTRDEGGRKQRFWTAVFVTGGKVWIVEAGGDEEHFKGPIADGIQKAIESLSIG